MASAEQEQMSAEKLKPRRCAPILSLPESLIKQQTSRKCISECTYLNVGGGGLHTHSSLDNSDCHPCDQGPHCRQDCENNCPIERRWECLGGDQICRPQPVPTIPGQPFIPDVVPREAEYPNLESPPPSPCDHDYSDYSPHPKSVSSMIHKDPPLPKHQNRPKKTKPKKQPVEIPFATVQKMLLGLSSTDIDDIPLDVGLMPWPMDRQPFDGWSYITITGFGGITKAFVFQPHPTMKRVLCLWSRVFNFAIYCRVKAEGGFKIRPAEQADFDAASNFSLVPKLMGGVDKSKRIADISVPTTPFHLVGDEKSDQDPEVKEEKQPVRLAPSRLHRLPAPVVALRPHTHCGNEHKESSGVQVGFVEREYSPEVTFTVGDLTVFRCRSRVFEHNLLLFLQKFPNFRIANFDVHHDGSYDCMSCCRVDPDHPLLNIVCKPKLLGGVREFIGPLTEHATKKKEESKLRHEEKLIKKAERKVKHEESNRPLLGPGNRKGIKEMKEQVARVERSERGVLSKDGAVPHNLNREFALGMSSIVQSYIKALLDPWGTQPPSLGFGVFSTGVNKMQMFIKYTFLTTAADAVVMLNPNGCCNTFNTTLTTTKLACYSSYTQLATPATAWSATGTATAASNCAIAGSAGTAVRVVSAGLKVEVGQAATAAAGVIYAGRIPLAPSTSCLDGFTNITAMSSPWCFSKRINITGCAKVSWAPMDSSDFAFVQSNSTMTTNLGTFLQPLVAGVTGVPTSTSITVTAVVNVEVGAGTGAGSNALSTFQAPSQPGQTTVASTVASPDQLMNQASGAGVPAVPVITTGGDSSADVPWYQQVYNGVSSAVSWLAGGSETASAVLDAVSWFLF